MNYNKKTVLDVEVHGKKVLLRCDFNVPQDKASGAITSDKRIVASLPTIKYLLENGAAVIACSHLGKPKGEKIAKLSLAPVAQRLAELLGKEVLFASDTVGEDAKAKAKALRPGQLLLLENTRYQIGEEKNDPVFAKELASLAELFVSD
ncbi:MAG: phosphoglycerate kinase, partial [Ruthenibacterium sp.]